MKHGLKAIPYPAQSIPAAFRLYHGGSPRAIACCPTETTIWVRVNTSTSQPLRMTRLPMLRPRVVVDLPGTVEPRQLVESGRPPCTSSMRGSCHRIAGY